MEINVKNSFDVIRYHFLHVLHVNQKSIEIEKPWLNNFRSGGRYFSPSKHHNMAGNIQVTFVSHHHEAYVSSMNFPFNQTFPHIQGLCSMAQLTNCWNFPKLLLDLFITFFFFFALTEAPSVSARLLNPLCTLTSLRHNHKKIYQNLVKANQTLKCSEQIYIS